MFFGFVNTVQTVTGNPEKSRKNMEVEKVIEEIELKLKISLVGIH